MEAILRHARRWIPAACCAAGVAAARAVPLDAQAALVGRVAGGVPLAPLSGAIVEIRGQDLRATTDTAGTFRIHGIRPGRHTIVVRQIGFRPLERRVRFAAGEEVRVGLQLEPIAVVLDSVTVRADDLTWPNPLMRDFDRRRELGIGKFADHHELAERKGQSLEAVLRRLGVRFERVRGGVIAVESRGSSNLSREPACAVNVLVDGVLIGGPRTAVRVDQLPKVADLAGIEYYRGSAQVPVMFETDGGMCGVLVLWSRLRR